MKSLIINSSTKVLSSNFFQKKIEKRGRKLIDFDKERHNVQQMQANPSRNEAKFAR